MERKINIKKKLNQSIALIFIGILIPVLSIMVDWRPENEKISTWFQRSGSLLVVFSVFVEFKLFALYSTIFPGEDTVVTKGDNVEKHKKLYQILSYLAAV